MGSKPDTWRRTASQQIADCRVFTVREDECVRTSDGRDGNFFVIENPNWVNVIALTADERVVLIEQFRHGVEKNILEIPGGMVDAGEDPGNAAKRELAEETGYTSSNWAFLGKSNPNPAIQNNEIFHFLARECVRTSEPRFDQHESIATRLVLVDEVRDLIIKGEIAHSLVIAAFYYFSAQGSNITNL